MADEPQEFTIRAERPEDAAAIRSLNERAFGRPNEADLVEKLRASDAFIPELSLVVDDDGEVVGHVMLSWVGLVGDEPGSTRRVLSLAPMAVAPERQGMGIGSELVRIAVAAADELGEPLVVVLGHEWFYPRFGFEPSERFGIASPFRVRPELFMVRRLCAYDPAIRGTVRYPDAFEGV